MKTKTPGICREFLKYAYILQLSEGCFSGPGLARKSGRSYGYTSNILKGMLSRGLITRIRGSSMIGSGGRSKIMGLKPAEYKLTKRGRSEIDVVLAGGVFDILHPGHVAFLKEARSHGDVLVVVIARDSTVVKRKGRDPFSSENNRLRMISSLRMVDAAILGSSKSFADTLGRVMPDTIFLGHDQHKDLSVMKRLAKKPGMKARLVMSENPLMEYSTSRILRTIKGS